MKKLIRIISIILCAVFSAIMLAACSTGAPDHDVSSPDYAIAPNVIAQKLDDFVTGREDRTMFGDKESLAAEYLFDELVGYGYDAALNEIDIVNNNSENLKTHNVVAMYAAAGDEPRKNVIIGAYYDNCNAKIVNVNTGSKNGTGTHGALANGTGVATLLSIAEYLNSEKPKLDFDVSIVFFGASSVYDYGARRYYADMTDTERSNTVLMIELQRLGVDHVYAYSDSRKTEREALFDRVAQENGLDIYKVTQKSPLITDGYALEGIPYYQWAQTGTFNIYFNNGIPTLNLVGANWETIDMSDNESADNKDIAFTANDTLANLKAMYPDYADKLAAAATLVVDSLTDADFLPTMIADKNNFPNTDIFAKRWVWNLIVIGVLAVVGIAMTGICAFLAKKYKYVPPAPSRPKKMQVAVFGMDYEEKDPNKIYIEFGNAAAPDEEIFPGIPNNGSDKKPPSNDPFDNR